MKKIVILIMLMLLLVALISCENSNKDSNSDTDFDSNIETVVVSFNTNGAEEMPDRTVIKGNSTFEPPTQPEKRGYIFDGWYFNDVKWNFANKVTENMTLHAKWRRIQYKITYVGGKGEVIAYTIEDEVILPVLVEDGYTFFGWSTNENFTDTITKIEKGTTGDLTLYAKKECFPFEYTLKDDGTYEITGIAIEDENKVIQHLSFPKTYNGKAITSIGDHAFQRIQIKLLDIPSNIKKIGFQAFNSSGLHSVRMEEGIKVIGANAFSANEYVTEIQLADSIEIIEEYAFNYCRTLVKINLPKNLKELGYSAFNSCASLIGPIEIPTGVTAIIDETFIGCTSLSSVKLHSGITQIGKQAFQQCKSLEEIEIFSGTIGEMAFIECEKLEKVILNDGVTEILSSAFEACYSLKEVVIPKSVEIVKSYAFGGVGQATIIYAEAESKPQGWEIDANWGYKNP